MSDSLADLMAEDVEEDVTALAEIQEEKVSRLSALAEDLRSKQDRIADLELELKDEKRAMYKLSDEDIPALMQELGMKDFTLQSGVKVAVSPTYGGHISQENQAEAFDWLRENDYDDIIKNVVSVQFGKGEDGDAAALYENLSESGYEPGNKQSVHSQTLKAWIRERVESGDSFPMNLFGAHIGQRAKIKSTRGRA